MYIGAAYYPELWDETEIEKDIEVCKSFGLNTLRIGEFAWSRMEPKEGKFEFDWLQNVMDKLHAAGIKVLLCTPTCTPKSTMSFTWPTICIIVSRLMPKASLPIRASPESFSNTRLYLTCCVMGILLS